MRKYLFVVGGSNPGQLAAYSLSAGAIGSASATISLTLPGFATDLIAPTAVTVLPNNNAVYVAAYDVSAYNPGGTVTSSANPGWVFGFAVGSSGTLTPTSGSPYQAGVKPTALTAEPTNRFLYVTDYASNELIGYSVQAGSALNFLVNGPFKTGNEPSAAVVDPRGLYIYVTNSLQIDRIGLQHRAAHRHPSTIIAATGTAANSTDTQPVSIVVDPALGRYIYTANYLGNSVSGFMLNPATGASAPPRPRPIPPAPTRRQSWPFHTATTPSSPSRRNPRSHPAQKSPATRRAFHLAQRHPGPPVPPVSKPAVVGVSKPPLGIPPAHNPFRSSLAKTFYTCSRRESP